MIRYLFLLTVVFLLVSCEMTSKQDLPVNVYVKSEELRSAILEYDSIIQSKSHIDDYLLAVCENRTNDSTVIYTIFYETGTASMQSSPISLAVIDGRYVEFVCVDNHYGVLTTDDNLRKNIARRFFPKEYTELEKGNPIDCYEFNDDIELQLTFCKDVLTSKKFIGYSSIE